MTLAFEQRIAALEAKYELAKGEKGEKGGDGLPGPQGKPGNIAAAVNNAEKATPSKTRLSTQPNRWHDRSDDR